MAKPMNHSKAATRAYSNLNMFYAIIALTENGLFRGCDPSLQKIRKICLGASAEMLEEYDTHIALAIHADPKDTP